MTASAGPIYGSNNGTINQMTVSSINLQSGSKFNDCPVGYGSTVEIAICPENEV